MNNILFIMADQLRHDTFGFKSKFPVKTPNIDALAARGTTFNLAHTPNPVCTPARACIMTGKPSYENGVYYNDQPWPESMSTWVQRLADNCYYTTCIGKTHFQPKRRSGGFNRLLFAGDQAAYLKKINAENLEKRKPSTGKTKDANYVNNAYPIEPTTVPLEHYAETFLTDQAILELDRIVERRDCSGTGVEPFLMKLSYMKPHSPCNPPEPYFSMYKPEDLPPPARSQEEIAGFSKQLKTSYDIWAKLDPERATKHRAQYMGCVTLIDDLVGRVVDKLKALDIYDNTLIILTSDHGDQLCDHHLQQKGYFWESSVRVPLIMAGPGVAQGHQVNDPVTLLDLYPTVLNYTQLSLGEYRDPKGNYIYKDKHEREGINLAPYLEGQDGLNPDRIIVAENAAYGQRIMIRKNNIKINYYINEEGPNEFDYFDLDKDPDELDNKGKSFTMNDMPADMRAELEKVLHRSSQFAGDFYYFQNKVRPMFT